MMNFSEEIENCLKDVRNTNNKEQNFQGRLYAHFLKFEEEGYIIEMETSINDEHIRELFSSNNFKKKEIDLLVYKPDFSEIYAAELKWIYYHDTTPRNVVDHLNQYIEDAIFCHQLKIQAGFTQTCSVVVYDFDPKKQVKKLNPNKNTLEKTNFLGGNYSICYTCGKIPFDENGSLIDFQWKDITSTIHKHHKYYIIKF